MSAARKDPTWAEIIRLLTEIRDVLREQNRDLAVSAALSERAGIERAGGRLH